MTSPLCLHLFKGYGVELEYMIVDRETLSILPIADRLLAAAAGEGAESGPEISVDRGLLSWSNELALHVVELKTTNPVSALDGVYKTFQEQIVEIDSLLQPLNARLMPTAMHPWMDPLTETRLWPHENMEIYNAFDRIFGCQGHGWSNLQSVHLNLPFANADEFGRLHAAIRMLMPVMPALAASSPVFELMAGEFLDNRMEAYRGNCAKVPSVTGRVIPEAVFSPEAYEREILQRMYRDIAPYDSEGTLQEEWLNARGAIARFDRNTIEIRVLDIQECPQADLAIVTAIADVLRALCEERFLSYAEQKTWDVEPLFAILQAAVCDAESAVITNRHYLSAFGLDTASATAGELWQHLFESVLTDASPEVMIPLNRIAQKGSLARRILRALDGDLSRLRVKEVYGKLCECLAAGEMF
ncbi:MAG: glutamate--cysteine ligase [Candidatus Hydrogenedentes bacterium]|nr:glutamate--cysteine ligase [Candidatus Hydrogenedentota bacterium]